MQDQNQNLQPTESPTSLSETQAFVNNELVKANYRIWRKIGKSHNEALKLIGTSDSEFQSL